MSTFTLSRERLGRIQHLLHRHSGELSVRDFARSFGVWTWEVEQAAALGWVQIETKKPHIGRPSRIVRQISNPEPAKLPPYRRRLERRISIRHWRFAMLSTMAAIKGGSSWAGDLLCFTDAYLKAFPRAKKRRAAATSMSRLLRHPSVRAAQAWHYSRLEGVIPNGEIMPNTASAIWNRLREAGSWRVGFLKAAYL